ncbi:MAG: peptide ABC transporter permease, partial [Erysipelothrix sp.]|nr:peptide ABC transporter permease [Erysipelothrix sp.]
GLSFLGFGVIPPSPSWGNMLTGAQDSTVITFYWWRWILPAVAVLIAALTVNIIGDGLRDAMDPKNNEK